MAKEIVIKTKEGLQHIFSLKEIVLKGELLAKYPSGTKVSLCPTQYAYGESYIDKLPEMLISSAAQTLIPVETDEVVDMKTEIIEEQGDMINE